jgi:hypothetical protein
MNVTMGREFARQMETTGGPIDIDEVQRKFPTKTRAEIERAMFRRATPGSTVISSAMTRPR